MSVRGMLVFGLGAALALPLGAVVSAAGGSRTDASVPCGAASAPFAPAPAYYGIEMVPTRRVPGTGRAVGTGTVTFARSPFGVAVSPRGTYVYDFSLTVDRIKPARHGVYTAWIASPDLDAVQRLGVLGEDRIVSGRIDWNKFLVVVTLEPADEPAGRWTGPIVMRGVSRSGLMHTLAGHGPYENEPCLKYGFK